MLSGNEEGVERRESRKTLNTEEEGRETARTGGRSGREGVVESVAGHGEASQRTGCGYGGGVAWRSGGASRPEMWEGMEGERGEEGEESDR